MVWSPAPTANTDSARSEPSRRTGPDGDRAASGLSFSRARRVTVEVATTAAAPGRAQARLRPAARGLRNTLPFALHEWHSSGGTTSRRPRARSATSSGSMSSVTTMTSAWQSSPSSRREERLRLLRDRVARSAGGRPELHRAALPCSSCPAARSWRPTPITRRLAAEASGTGSSGRASRGRSARPWPPRGSLGVAAAGLDYVVDLRADVGRVPRGLKRNIRESLRHCYNSLKRDGLSFELEVAQTPDAVRNALHTFVSLHAMRAGLTRTVTHPDRFASDTSRRFLYEVCDRLAARGVGARVRPEDPRMRRRGAHRVRRRRAALSLLFGLRSALGEVQRVDDRSSRRR